MAPEMSAISTSFKATYQLITCSENGLIASKNAIDDAFHLVRDEYHKNRTKVKVVELY